MGSSLVGVGMFGFTLSWDEIARTSQAIAISIRRRWSCRVHQHGHYSRFLFAGYRYNGRVLSGHWHNRNPYKTDGAAAIEGQPEAFEPCLIHTKPHALTARFPAMDGLRIWPLTAGTN